MQCDYGDDDHTLATEETMSEPNSIREQLSAIRRILASMQRSVQSQAIAPCCAVDPDGGRVPVLVPREEPVLIPVEDPDRCARIAGSLRATVERWNELWVQPEPIILTPQGLLEWITVGIFASAWSYVTLTKAQELADAIGRNISEAGTIDYGEVDWCAATRQYIQSDGAVPDAILSALPGVLQPVFQAYWALLGGISWSQSLNMADLPFVDVSPSCCLPDVFYLYMVPAFVSCPSGSGTVDVLGSISDDIDPGIVIPALGFIRRSAIAGMYLEQVAAPGRFNLWYWETYDLMLNGLCLPFTGELGNGASYYVHPDGSPYIGIRNRTLDEGVYLSVGRTPTFTNIINI